MSFKASNRSSSLLFGVLILALVNVVGGCSQKPAASGSADGMTRPNVIFILIDTLRADRLGSYGSTGGHSPTLDAIAADGVVFEDAISAAPWTQPSIASLFSSVYPGAHRVTNYDVAYDGATRGQAKVPVFSEKFVTLAEVLQAAGFHTAAFSANPFVVKDFGFAQGFDHFDSSFANNMTPGSMVNNAALDWLRQRDPNAPFFLYLHYMDVHGPYDASPEVFDPLVAQVEQMSDRQRLTEDELKRLYYLDKPPSFQRDPTQYTRLRVYREYWEARYNAGVREVDRHLGTLQKRLEELGLWKDTYIIVTADHGEALCEHGVWDHGFSVHDYEVHVPLILRWPGALPNGQRVAGTVRLIDVMPTILNQLALKPPAGIQGISILPNIREGPPDSPIPALAEAVKAGPEQKALYRGRWKLVWLAQPPQGVPAHLLYNIQRDPLEQTNLGSIDPAERISLANALERQLAENAELARAVELQHATLDEAQRRQFSGLGYIDTGTSPAPTSQPAAP